MQNELSFVTLEGNQDLDKKKHSFSDIFSLKIYLSVTICRR